VILRFVLCAALAAAAAGCGPNYSPNTYASNAVQQANKVDQGVLVGVREVGVSASGTTGALVGGAAGGIAGSQVGTGAGSAFGALGGSLVGGLAGSAAEHVSGDTRAFEYIVRKANGDLLSVTQKDEAPLSIGRRVLVIAGNQARVVPDYTTPAEPPKEAAMAPKETPPTTTAPPPAPVAAAPLTPSPPAPAAPLPAASPQPIDQPKAETGTP
jgi:outer membrane lipoprotein SlyB